MQLVAIIVVLALVEYLFFSFRVGTGRGTYGVAAPAISGHPEWERLFRVQQNTLEQLIVFLPSILLCATFVGETIAAGLGVVFLVGRLVYAAAYVRKPETRTAGFVMGFLANIAMLLSGLVGAVLEMI